MAYYIPQVQVLRNRINGNWVSVARGYFRSSATRPIWNSIILRLSEGAIDDACPRGVEPPAAFDPVLRTQTARNCASDMTFQICWSSVTYSRWILPRWSTSAILFAGPTSQAGFRRR